MECSVSHEKSAILTRPISSVRLTEPDKCLEGLRRPQATEDPFRRSCRRCFLAAPMRPRPGEIFSRLLSNPVKLKRNRPAPRSGQRDRPACEAGRQPSCKAPGGQVGARTHAAGGYG